MDLLQEAFGLQAKHRQAHVSFGEGCPRADVYLLCLRPNCGVPHKVCLEAGAARFTCLWALMDVARDDLGDVADLANACVTNEVR